MAVQPQHMPPRPPPVPPMPPGPWSPDQMQDIIDVQARTIRALLANYEALLRQVGAAADPPYELDWTLKTQQNFAANAPIASAWWFNGTAGTVSINLGGTILATIASGNSFFAPPLTSNGAAATQLREIDAKVVLITP